MDETTNILEFIRTEGIVPGLLALIVTAVIVRIVGNALERLGKRWNERRLALHQASTIARLMIYLLGIGFAVSLVVRLSDQALLTLGGTVAVAVGISLRDLVSSIIAGITILIDKPFSVGDRIKYGDVYGEVVEIGLRAVRVVTLDDNLVTIPNNKFLTDVVASGNAGELDMLVQMDFYVSLESDLGRAKALLGEGLVSSRFAYLNKPWTLVVNQVIHGDFVAVRLRAKVYVVDLRYEKALETDVTERVMRAFSQSGIKGPSVMLHA